MKAQAELKHHLILPIFGCSHIMWKADQNNYPIFSETLIDISIPHTGTEIVFHTTAVCWKRELHVMICSYNM